MSTKPKQPAPIHEDLGMHTDLVYMCLPLIAMAVCFYGIRVALLCGTVLAGANFAKLMLLDRMVFHNPITVTVAAVICLTLVCTVFAAKIVGCMLPLLAKKIGFDPAVMASPFITTIVDALSLLIYFRFASFLLGI